jgi:hypothetical protein
MPAPQNDGPFSSGMGGGFGGLGTGGIGSGLDGGLAGLNEIPTMNLGGGSRRNSLKYAGGGATSGQSVGGRS